MSVIINILGIIINKADLPIGSLILNDITDENSATFMVGRLRCAPQQIGLYNLVVPFSI